MPSEAAIRGIPQLARLSKLGSSLLLLAFVFLHCLAPFHYSAGHRSHGQVVIVSSGGQRRPNSSQQPTACRSLARGFRPSCFAGLRVSWSAREGTRSAERKN